MAISKEPSTENLKNAIMEETHWVNTKSSLTENSLQQRKTRVSELSIIDVNDPLPTKRVHSPSDYNLESKKLQETGTERRQVQENPSRFMREQQESYSSIGKKFRRSRLDDKTNPRWS